tara:strand:+ start:81 stop:209 length:129 start_codon:yes stop_codon:yes gene_type:complete
MILNTMAKIGEYKKESIGIVIKPEANPKNPLINPENKITITK